MANHNAINEVLKFGEIFFQILTEYQKVVEPVASCLDSLQGEANAYMGTLLPTLHIMKKTLEELMHEGNLIYAKPLVSALLTSYEKRFSRLYDDEKLVIATAVHPHYTPAVLTALAPGQKEYIENIIIRELQSLSRTDTQDQISVVDKPQDRVSKFLLGGAVAVRTTSVEDNIRAALRKWERELMETKITKNLFPVEHREAWVELFIKYNTPLPSSAAVERLFCMGRDILRAKRSSLSSTNFQQLVFLKGNLDLLKLSEVAREVAGSVKVDSD